MIDNLFDIIVDALRYNEKEPWLFSRLPFWLFFTLVIGLYSFFHKRVRRRNVFLLIVSLFFYYKAGGWFCFLLVFSCLLNYSFGRFIVRASGLFWKKTFLALGVSLNLALLVFFKYAYFFTDVLNRFWGDVFEPYNWLAHVWNFLPLTKVDTLSIVLPVGISFFTFQAISYLVDLKRGHTQVVTNIFDFSFYLSFFPQLVAGPIVRASNFIPQLYKPYAINKQEFGHAVFLISLGLIKKIILADYLSVNLIDRVFDSPGNYSGAENLMAVYGYALQIYGDFSGYTDIAIGLALLLGFKLPVNFNSPYKATSLTDFWRRWHISLSSWLRDYLYIPLGGNRKGKIRTSINLLTTMVLGGLWHGASFSFVLWGTLHGLVLVVEKTFLPIRKRFINKKYLQPFFVFFIFHVVCLGWIFFRAESGANINIMLNKIWFTLSMSGLYDYVLAYPLVFSIIVAGMLIHWLPSVLHERVRGAFIRLPLWLKTVFVLLLLFILQKFIQADIQPFIYFRF
ncbi:MAG: MBOAT family protein [Prolixibacteraceae bacterium]|jgi:D-alanyl-lipoteichoic acid acyltransferase DltB (MBOAT superfamily)|nr:MBOAT family protein [Prolixibacteraceae bacterium]